MSTTTSHANKFIQDASTSLGPVEIVDAFLQYCCETQLHLRWTTNLLRVRHTDGSVERAEMVFPKSHFRAVLARLAVRCNELKPFSVSPFGGKAVLRLPQQKTALRVLFANTPSHQFVDVRPAQIRQSQLQQVEQRLDSLNQELQQVRQQLEKLAASR